MKDSETALQTLLEECIKYPGKRKEFIAEGTVELLLKLCHRPLIKNLQLSNYALAALGILAHGNNDAKAKIIEVDALSNILAFCKPQKKISEENDIFMCQKQLMAHEQASLVIRKLSFDNSACQTELINAGALKNLIGLCDVFNPTGKHADCCYIQQEFPAEAKHLLSELTYGKHLIGKVRELVGHERQEKAKYLSETGCPIVHCYTNSRLLSVKLYDTTTDKDIDIAKELVHSGSVWPCLKECLPKLDKGKNEEAGCCWYDISVSQVIDGGHFWAHVGGEEALHQMENIRKELQRENLPQPKNIPQPGDMVCIHGTIAGHQNLYRAVILEMARELEDYVVKVLAVDYGYIAVLPGSTVRLLSTELASVPPQVTLCCLEGVQAPPQRTYVLENAAGALRNLSQENSNCRFYIGTLEGVEAILKLCSIPNKEVLKQATGALLNLALHNKNRARMGYLGGINTMLELCQRYPNEDEILELAVGTLQNMMVGSTVNRGRVVDSQGLTILAEIYHSSENEHVKQRTLEAVKNLVGSSNPINPCDEKYAGTFQQAEGTIDVRNMMEDDVKKKFSLSVPCQNQKSQPHHLRSRSGRRRRRLRKGEVEPNPTRVTLPLEAIQRNGYSTGESDSENYLSGLTSCDDTDGDTDRENLIGSDSDSAANEQEKDVQNKRFYVQENKIPFVEDEEHEFRTQTNVKHFKRAPVAKVLCAFLNSQKCGTLYYGVRSNSVVDGIIINRTERDMFRLGIDELLDTFSPAVMHDCYKIEFVPVVRKAGHHNPLTRITCQDRFVIEISITKCNDVIYATPSGKCYFRKKTLNLEMNSQDIREKTIKEQEAMYNREIESLSLEIKKVKRHLLEKSLETLNGERRFEQADTTRLTDSKFTRRSPGPVSNSDKYNSQSSLKTETIAQSSTSKSGGGGLSHLSSSVNSYVPEDELEGPQCVIS